MEKFQKRIYFSLFLYLGLAQFSWGQILSGNVTDEQDVPLPGAKLSLNKLTLEFHLILMVIFRLMLKKVKSYKLVLLDTLRKKFCILARIR